MMRFSSPTILLLLLLVAGSTPGCASVTARMGTYGAPADLYPGVYHLLAGAKLRGRILPTDSWIDTVLTIIDIPLTAVFDTAMLPIDLLYSGFSVLVEEDPGAVPDPPGYHRPKGTVPEDLHRDPGVLRDR